MHLYTQNTTYFAYAAPKMTLTSHMYSAKYVKNGFTLIVWDLKVIATLMMFTFAKHANLRKPIHAISFYWFFLHYLRLNATICV